MLAASLQKRQIRTRQRGSVIVLTAAMTIFFTILGLTTFHFIRVLGGYRECTTALDSGTINVAKRAQEIAVGLESPDEQQFSDVADAKGNITLRNINKVWGKALLAGVNQTAMQNRGTSSPTSAEHAQRLYAAAQSLSSTLAKKLKMQSNLQGYFSQLSTINSVRLTGNQSVVDVRAGAGWQVAYADQGGPSDIRVADGEMPDGFDQSALKLRVVNGTAYLPGYTDIEILGNKYPLVPFKANAQPALIDKKTFDAAQKPSWVENPVPNAFSTAAQVKESTTGQLVSLGAFGQSQIGNGGTALRIPHGWIRIRLHKNEVKVWVDGAKVYEQDYDYARDVTFLPPSLRADIGNEVSVHQPTVWDAMFVKFGDPGYENVKGNMVQRIRELKPDFAPSELEHLLRSKQVARHWSGPNQDFYIVLDTQGRVVLQSEFDARTATPWLLGVVANPADGLSIPIADEKLGSGGNRADSASEPQNLATPPAHAVVVGVSTGGVHYYSPSTGFDGMLGEFFLKRTIDIKVIMAP